MKIILCAAVLVLAGCGATTPVKTTVEVPVPIKVPCVDKSQVPARPKYETEKLDLDKTPDGEVMLATTRDWVRSRSYEKKLEAIAKGCSSLQKPTS